MTAPSRRPFGVTPAGEQVEIITLNNGTLSCSILTYGAILRSLCVPDRSGIPVDVVLGFDTLEEYLSDTEYIGAVVGRFANRIAAGRFTLDGKEYTLATNDGPNHMHGGNAGYSHRVWSVESVTDTQAVLTLFSPDGEEGFPGNLQAKVTYRLEDAALAIHYRAETDQATPCSLTNHSYFNLSGHDSGSAMDQQVTMYASRYTPADDHCLVLGTVEPVDGTPMDLRASTAIGTHIDDDFQQLRSAGGYDHNYVIDNADGTLRPAARAASAKTGITMLAETTLPGLQLYTANTLPLCRGKDGAEYQCRNSYCLETQSFPDAPNRANFPSAILRPGEVYDHTTRFVFSVEK